MGPNGLAKLRKGDGRKVLVAYLVKRREACLESRTDETWELREPPSETSVLVMEVIIIERETLQLPDCERAVLADRLLASLSRWPAGLDEAWLREADERMAAYRVGSIEAVSGPEALAELRREFRR